MINKGKYPVLGINIHAVDYEGAVATIMSAARSGSPCSVSALAVHGVMTGHGDDVHRRRLNALDLVVPDGQPVRWALKWLHGVSLPDRVYGPNLTLFLIEAAEREGVPVYFYGSTGETLAALRSNLTNNYPNLKIAGMQASRFRKLAPEEKDEVVEEIKASGARMVFVGLGCPRQEVWAYEYRKALSIPLIAVGAAFDFHAGTLPQAPRWMQNAGLEWLFRLKEEPKRLWRRYLYLNPAYLWNVFLQALSIKILPIAMPLGNEPEESYG